MILFRKILGFFMEIKNKRLLKILFVLLQNSIVASTIFLDIGPIKYLNIMAL
jgi:hypothetical protein